MRNRKGIIFTALLMAGTLALCSCGGTKDSGNGKGSGEMKNALSVSSGTGSSKEDPGKQQGLKWWQKTIAYEIYVKSFKDSDGGAFGTFVHRSNAAVLGIIPRECKGKTTKSGDIALVGASSAALSEDARKELIRIQKDVQVIDLPTHPMFSDAFMDGMIIE